MSGDKKIKTPMEHWNIGEFNKGQASKIIRNYQRIFEQGIDINDL